jgi:hypothetical protein
MLMETIAGPGEAVEDLKIACSGGGDVGRAPA